MRSRCHRAFAVLLVLGLSSAACGPQRVYGGVAEVPQPPDAQAGDVLPAFPWPPPHWSARCELPRGLFVVPGRRTQWGDVADRLQGAFLDCGYGELAFYSAPGGFAIVSQFEQINDDGTPKAGDARWSRGIARAGSSFSDFFKSLFTAVTGHYRVVVFVVTDEAIPLNGGQPTEAESQAWMHAGLDSLPQSLRSQSMEPTHRVVALIYEFKRADSDQSAELMNPSALLGDKHLERAQLKSRLGF